MRAFLVLALVAFAAADVKHLYDAPYTQTVTTNFGQGSSGSGSLGTLGSTTNTQYVSSPVVTTTKQEFVSTPVVTKQEFISTPVVTKQEFISPATTTFVSQGSSIPNTEFISTTSTGSGSGSSGLGLGLGGSNTQYTTTYSGSSGSGLGQRFDSGFSGAYNGGSSNINVAYNTKVVKQTQPLVTKAHYVFAAPEDKESFQHDQEIVLPRPRQHYNVVFIKAPATTIVNTPSAAVGGLAQEKTLVYVLTDKKRIENRIEVPEVDQAKLQKPEVFFVKNNKPTEVVNSKIKYETVSAINGAENGALNGVPNKASGNGVLLDDYTNPEVAQIAQTIYNAVQTGGLESGIHTIDSLSSLGYSIGGNFGGNTGSQYTTGGQYNLGSTGGQTYYTSGSSTGLGLNDKIGSVNTHYVQGPSTTYTTGFVAPVSQTSTTYSEGYKY